MVLLHRSVFSFVILFDFKKHLYVIFMLLLFLHSVQTRMGNSSWESFRHKVFGRRKEGILLIILL